MEIEKSLVVAAPVERLWATLLDPEAMAACVPGMQAVEVISDKEYVAYVHVKLAFISARFKVRTLVAEMRAPHYLRSESTGEDAAVASSLKSVSELFLTPGDGGQTELRVKVKAGLFGRLGTFGMNVMKTKADLMWDEFGRNLAAHMAGSAHPAQIANQVEPVTAADGRQESQPATVCSAPVPQGGPRPRWWRRLLASASPEPELIRVEIRRGDTTVLVHWPVHSADACARWLKEQLKEV